MNNKYEMQMLITYFLCSYGLCNLILLEDGAADVRETLTHFFKVDNWRLENLMFSKFQLGIVGKLGRFGNGFGHEWGLNFEILFSFFVFLFIISYT